MPSHDKRWYIERYLNYDEFGKLENFSYGCSDLDLMGYKEIRELFADMPTKIYEAEVDTKMENED